MRKMILVWLSIVAIFMACTAEEITPATGSLDVSVSVGPLCPVEPCNISADKIKAVYETYGFVVTNVSTKKVVLEQKISYNGTKGVLKSASIPVGEYEIDITPKNVITSRGFPKTFTIEKDKTTVLDISIDTGIR